jgi:pectin methylesterase-like acyl-CoA thioesterase
MLATFKRFLGMIVYYEKGPVPRAIYLYSQGMAIPPLCRTSNLLACHTACVFRSIGLHAMIGLALLVPAQGIHAVVAKRKFDFVVGVDGDWKAAVAAAAKKASPTYRYYIFFPDGEYNVGALTGDSNQKTTFTIANVSFIGQSADRSILFNKAVKEGIGITATLFLNNANNMYMQDLTVMNRANYGQSSTYSQTGRYVAIQEQADKMIYMNVKQLSTQDTYFTSGARTYWEGGQIDGTTDFICGGGSIYFKGVQLNELKDGSPITASSSNNNPWGYVFESCTINATKAGYQLGRSWGEGRVVFLRTTMKQLASDGGWGNPMNNVPKVFAEYKTVDANGKPVDLSKRRTTYTKDAITVKLNPVLSDAEAAKFTLANVLGGSDNWKPDELARQVSAPVFRLEGKTLKWNDNDSALCWAVFKGGKYLETVTTGSFDLAKLATGDVLTVRAANSMGGLGASSNPFTVGQDVGITFPLAPHSIHTLAQAGHLLRVPPLQGDASLRILDVNGSLKRGSRLSALEEARTIDMAAQGLGAGVYFVRIDGLGIRGETIRIQLAE